VLGLKIWPQERFKYKKIKLTLNSFGDVILGEDDTNDKSFKRCVEDADGFGVNRYCEDPFDGDGVGNNWFVEP
jgi:hypothetical protein